LIYSPPQHAEIRYRPSYAEIASVNICQGYETTESDLIASRESSEYVRKTIAQIELDNQLEKLASLPTNWDTCGTEGPSQQAVSAAAAIAKAFINFGLVPDAITPSAEGGIAICFVRNEKYADIECFNSGDILAVRYSSHEDPRAWAIQPDAVATDATIQTFAKYLSA
jgi:hypothetical protein